MDKQQRAGRDGARLIVLRDLRADVRYGLRMMRKSRGFTLVAVLTLALGIGANSAMFAILYGILYRPLPFADESRTAMVHMNFSPQNNPRGNLCVADFLDWRNGNTAFSQVAAYSRSRFTLTGEVQAEQVAGATVTGDFFSILGLQSWGARSSRAMTQPPALTWW